MPLPSAQLAEWEIDYTSGLPMGPEKHLILHPTLHRTIPGIEVVASYVEEEPDENAPGRIATLFIVPHGYCDHRVTICMLCLDSWQGDFSLLTLDGTPEFDCQLTMLARGV